MKERNSTANNAAAYVDVGCENLCVNYWEGVSTEVELSGVMFLFCS